MFPKTRETQFILWKSQEHSLENPHVDKYMKELTILYTLGSPVSLLNLVLGLLQATCPYSFVQVKIFYHANLYSVILKLLSLEERFL